MDVYVQTKDIIVRQTTLVERIKVTVKVMNRQIVIAIAKCQRMTSFLMKRIELKEMFPAHCDA